jgi:hypothetical protein
MKVIAWTLLGVVLAAGLASTSTFAAGTEVPAGSSASVTVYGKTDWYLRRPERERRWRGTLNDRPATAGPGTRTALAFALVSHEAVYLVYAAGVEKELSRFVGQPVEVDGKLVDLADEGLGKELWIATIRLLAAGQGLR